MTALEKGLQWERALELFDEMKRTNLPITVVSYGSALSACDKGLQYRQCLEFLDEMTEMGIAKVRTNRRVVGVGDRMAHHNVD
jgi:pentatricopeptide repeat domain-containing protein 1